MHSPEAHEWLWPWTLGAPYCPSSYLMSEPLLHTRGIALSERRRSGCRPLTRQTRRGRPHRRTSPAVPWTAARRLLRRSARLRQVRIMLHSAHASVSSAHATPRRFKAEKQCDACHALFQSAAPALLSGQHLIARARDEGACCSALSSTLRAPPCGRAPLCAQCYQLYERVDCQSGAVLGARCWHAHCR